MPVRLLSGFFSFLSLLLYSSILQIYLRIIVLWSSFPLLLYNSLLCIPISHNQNISCTLYHSFPVHLFFFFPTLLIISTPYLLVSLFLFLSSQFFSTLSQFSSLLFSPFLFSFFLLLPLLLSLQFIFNLTALSYHCSIFLGQCSDFISLCHIFPFILCLNSSPNSLPAYTLPLAVIWTSVYIHPLSLFLLKIPHHFKLQYSNF